MTAAANPWMQSGYRREARICLYFLRLDFGDGFKFALIALNNCASRQCICKPPVQMRVRAECERFAGWLGGAFWSSKNEGQERYFPI
jgi:hypothetical protein